MILFDHGPMGAPALFDTPRRRIIAQTAAEVPQALRAMEAARAAGLWLAGHAAYELGYALEPRLAGLMPQERRGPLLSFGAYDSPRPGDAALAACDAAVGATGAAPLLAPVQPDWSADRYASAFDRVARYIRAGDCYQVNLTFPLRSQLRPGTDAAALYGALRRVQPVQFGAFVDFGGDDRGPVILSRSPELFFRLDTAGGIETRPMKGTAPRDADPARDAALKAGLIESEKNRAENLMIVDLLRNDLGRLCEIGSIRVPRFFEIETYATLHQMVSAITGRLRPGVGIAALLAALFPCGSVTGAPKIRAMEIIRDLEPGPRGAYCGAIGWFAPDGSAEFNVAIRTLSLFSGGEVVLNVGGGIVHDSTAPGEYEEALWKARFAAMI